LSGLTARTPAGHELALGTTRSYKKAAQSLSKFPLATRLVLSVAVAVVQVSVTAGVVGTTVDVHFEGLELRTTVVGQDGNVGTLLSKTSKLYVQLSWFEGLVP